VKTFIRIGVDLAKNYFQIHALASEGDPAVTRKLKRSKMHEFFSQIEPCLIGMQGNRISKQGEQLCEVGFVPTCSFDFSA